MLQRLVCVRIQKQDATPIQRQNQFAPHRIRLVRRTILGPHPFHGKETAAEQRPRGQHAQELRLHLAGHQTSDRRPRRLDERHPLRGTHVANAQRRFGQQEFDLLHCGHVIEVGGAV